MKFFEHTREVLAIFWSVASVVIIGYIVYVFGFKTEILTLMIGLISGTLNGIMGTYFSAQIQKRQQSGTDVTQMDVAADNVEVKEK